MSIPTAKIAVFKGYDLEVHVTRSDTAEPLICAAKAKGVKLA